MNSNTSSNKEIYSIISLKLDEVYNTSTLIPIDLNESICLTIIEIND